MSETISQSQPVLNESLSALMDGEASELELRRILTSEDPALRGQWAAMHRHRDAAVDELPFADLDVSYRVMAELDSLEQDKASGGWRQTVAGLAVAASVAAVVVFAGSFGQLGGSDDFVADSGRVYPVSVGSTTGQVPVSAEFSSGLPVPQSSVAPAPEYDALAAQQARERFRALLQKHTANAALNNGQGIVSYARLVEEQ